MARNPFNTPMTEPTLKPVPLEQTRQRIINLLCEHYAAENLNDSGLEERLTRAYAASSVPALQELVADLPSEPVTSGPGSGVAIAPAGLAPENGVVLAVMGAAERKGAWLPPRQLTVLAVMGGVELDFREARFSPGITDVNIFAMMGGVEITVSPDVRVEMNGAGLMGGFGHSGGRDLPADPNAPVLRIRGLAIMGGVDLKARYPGESAGDANRRERETRREARRLNRGR
jgi:hypothetical protein